MRVVCAPAETLIPVEDGIFFSMMAPGPPTAGRVGLKIRQEIRRQGLVPDPASWDFLILALAIIAADKGCLRSDSPDGWTRKIDLHVALHEPSRWHAEVGYLSRALQFLTGDIWTISIYTGGLPPLQYSHGRHGKDRDIVGDCVCLLSGGVDSLVGAIDVSQAGAVPILVSQVVQGDRKRQALFAREVGKNLPHIEEGLSHIHLSHAAWCPGEMEHSQRARSIGFLAFGLIAASALSHRIRSLRLLVPENGFISHNVPLTPLRIGSLSTRTTHPYFLRAIERIWQGVGLDVSITNPYIYRTKGEMLRECRSQELLASLVFEATSCGRFGRTGYTHCGRCVPCIARRSAFMRWGRGDSTRYHYNLSEEAGFDDVRSVALACAEVAESSVSEWAGNALNGGYVGDVSQATGVVGRGLSELRMLLAHFGLL